MKRKAQKKPQLEWKLAYVENGKRRLALTEEEDRELDAIIESHDKNLNYIAGSLEYMKTELTALSQHRNIWPREIAKELLSILERADQNFNDGYSVVSDLVFLDGAVTHIVSEIERRKQKPEPANAGKQKKFKARLDVYRDLLKLSYKDFLEETRKRDLPAKHRSVFDRWKKLV